MNAHCNYWISNKKTIHKEKTCLVFAKVSNEKVTRNICNSHRAFPRSVHA